MHKLVKGAYWTGRYIIALPFWFISGLLLYWIGIILWFARLLRSGQVGFSRAGNWLMSGEARSEELDLRIERRLRRRRLSIFWPDGLTVYERKIERLMEALADKVASND